MTDQGHIDSRIEKKRFDVAVLGGGPGGYVAAIRAAQLGASVCLVEEDRLGGTCLNWGCIPSKVLVSAAETIRGAEESKRVGIEFGNPTIDRTALMGRLDEVTSNLRKGVAGLLKKNGVTVIKGRGHFVSDGRLEVGGQGVVEASDYIIATGSRPASVLGGWSERLKPVERIFSDGLPESTVIVGGGAVGCEMAGALSLLGTKVWLVEILPELIPGEDRDLGGFVRRALKKQGVQVRVDTRIGGIETDGSKTVVRIDEDEIECNMVLEATGRRPVTTELGLEDIGIELDNGFVKVTESMETSREGYFAIGDVTPGPQLAHVASKGGLVAADNILGGSSRLGLHAVPSCVFSIPPVASVGVSPGKEGTGDLEEIRIPFGSNSAAYSRGKGDGFIKLVVDSNDATLRGAQVAGDEANLMIAELTLAVSKGMKVGELADVIRAHPTLAEIVGEASEAFYGKSIHFYRPQAKSGKG